MSIKQDIEFLKRANKWRRGDESIEMPDPKKYGECIDRVIKVLEEIELRKNDRSEAGEEAEGN